MLNPFAFRGYTKTCTNIFQGHINLSTSNSSTKSTTQKNSKVSIKFPNQILIKQPRIRYEINNPLIMQYCRKLKARREKSANITKLQKEYIALSEIRHHSSLLQGWLKLLLVRVRSI